MAADRGLDAAATADRRRVFDEVYEAHSRAVLAFAARRTSTLADAEDVTAETFIVAWRRFDRVPAPEHARPWLFAVARRVIANARRSSDRRRRLDERLASAPSRPEPLLAGAARTPAVAALERLAPDDQEILKLVAWEGLTHVEIAAVFGITANAVAIRLHRARRRYEEALAAEERAPDVKGFSVSRTFANVRGRMFGSAGRHEAR